MNDIIVGSIVSLCLGAAIIIGLHFEVKRDKFWLDKYNQERIKRGKQDN